MSELNCSLFEMSNKIIHYLRINFSLFLRPWEKHLRLGTLWMLVYIKMICCNFIQVRWIDLFRISFPIRIRLLLLLSNSTLNFKRVFIRFMTFIIHICSLILAINGMICSIDRVLAIASLRHIFRDCYSFHGFIYLDLVVVLFY